MNVKITQKSFYKKTVALLLAMLVLLGGIISASAQTLNVQEKGKISMSISNDTKTLNIIRDGHDIYIHFMDFGQL